MKYRFCSLLWRWMIEYFPGSGQQMKDIKCCSRNNFQVFAIFFLHHKHLRAITSTSSCFLNNLSLFSDNRHLYLGQEIYFTSVCRDKQLYEQEHLGPKTTIFSLMCILGLRQSHFRNRAFRIYGKFWRTWCVIKLYAYKDWKALCDFQ